jgi:hypothetical protein
MWEVVVGGTEIIKQNMSVHMTDICWKTHHLYIHYRPHHLHINVVEKTTKRWRLINNNMYIHTRYRDINGYLVHFQTDHHGGVMLSIINLVVI